MSVPRRLGPLFAIATLVVAGACGGDDDGSATTTAAATTAAPTTAAATTAAPTTAAPTTAPAVDDATRQTIVDLWATFFATDTPLEERIAVIEDGESLREAVELALQHPLFKAASGEVKQLEFDGPDRIRVTYDVMVSGNVMLPDSLGIAVRQDGVWKVSASTFCALAGLALPEGAPGC